MRVVLVRTSIYLLGVLVLAACGHTSAKVSAVEKKALYQLPTTYKQHRQQQQFFKTRDGDIAYTDYGQGPVLVLLHGVPTSSWLYRKVMPGLQTHFRVVSVDLLGFGSSAKPSDNGRNYLAVEQAKRVLSLLDSLDIQSFNLLMHDMGGLVAWEMLNTNVERVDNMIVLNTIVHKEGFNHPNINPGVLTRQMTKAYSSKLTSAAVLELTFNNLGLTGDYRLSEAECNGYVAPMKEGSDQALYRFFTGFDEALFQKLENNASTFERFKGQTLVIWGGKDKVLTIEQIPFLQQHLHIPEDNIHIFADNNHFIVEEIPSKVTALITGFLKS